MVEKNVKIQLPTGLHARPVSLLVNLVKTYDGDTEMIFKDKTADLKSIINVMALSVKCGDEITIRVNGPEEEKMADEIVDLIENFKD